MALLWVTELLLVCVTLHYLLLAPLRKIPGPWYTRISSVWLAMQCRQGRRAKAVHKLHQQYGNVVRISANHVSINDTNTLHEIFTRDRQYPKGPWYNTFKSGDPTTNNIVSLDSADIHREMRKDMSPAFSPRALREFEPRMSKYHQLFKEHLLDKTRRNDGEVEIDLNPWASLLAFDIIAEFSFGKPFGFLEKGRDDEGLMLALERRGMVANALGVLPMWIRPYMPWIPFDEFWKASAASIAKIKQLSEAATIERLAAADDNSQSNVHETSQDLLSYMLHAKSVEGESWPRQRILNQATQTVIAGSDSTAASTIHLIDFISRHPDVQKNIQEEIDSVFPKPRAADWMPLDADTTQLTYTRAVIYEALRLVPTAASGFERVVTQPDTYFLGYHLPIGTLVSVPTWTLHRSPEVFEDPEVFRPERWMGGGSSEGAWNLFSQGPRNCIGKNFAMMEIVKTIVVVFGGLDVERVGGEETETETEEGFFLKAKECLVRIRERR